jgi:hypothetical protein
MPNDELQEPQREENGILFSTTVVGGTSVYRLVVPVGQKITKVEYENGGICVVVHSVADGEGNAV